MLRRSRFRCLAPLEMVEPVLVGRAGAGASESKPPTCPDGPSAGAHHQGGEVRPHAGGLLPRERPDLVTELLERGLAKPYMP